MARRTPCQHRARREGSPCPTEPDSQAGSQSHRKLWSAFHAKRKRRVRARVLLLEFVIAPQIASDPPQAIKWEEVELGCECNVYM